MLVTPAAPPASAIRIWSVSIPNSTSKYPPVAPLKMVSGSPTAALPTTTVPSSKQTKAVAMLTTCATSRPHPGPVAAGGRTGQQQVLHPARRLADGGRGLPQALPVEALQGQQVGDRQVVSHAL